MNIEYKSKKITIVYRRFYIKKYLNQLNCSDGARQQAYSQHMTKHLM